MSAVEPSAEARAASKWELFQDENYFDEWAVRPVGERRWGHCFHLPLYDDAKGLLDLLNEQAAALEAKQQEIERLRTGLHCQDRVMEVCNEFSREARKPIEDLWPEVERPPGFRMICDKLHEIRQERDTLAQQLADKEQQLEQAVRLASALTSYRIEERTSPKLMLCKYNVALAEFHDGTLTDARQIGAALDGIDRFLSSPAIAPIRERVRGGGK